MRTFDRSSYKYVLAILAILCIFISGFFSGLTQKKPRQFHQNSPGFLARFWNYNRAPRVWASMGLCYSETAKHKDKSSYPYKEVTYLSLLLWQYHLPEVSTMVRIVYTEQEVNETMVAYGEMLESAGAVVEWVRAEMDCVLQSQLVR